MEDFNSRKALIDEDKIEKKRQSSVKRCIKLTPPQIRKQSEIRTLISINSMPRQRGMS